MGREVVRNWQEQEGEETIIKIICMKKISVFKKKKEEEEKKCERLWKTNTLRRKQRLSENRFLILPDNHRREMFKLFWFHILEILKTFFFLKLLHVIAFSCLL